jgi:hypothetical protein
MLVTAAIAAATDSLATIKRQQEQSTMKDLRVMFDMHGDDGNAWGACWLAGETEWWPDNIPLEESNGLTRQGDPSSPMPALAIERTQILRDAGEQYVVHISPGLHAYRIGVVSDYALAAEAA